jgi:F-type H+-transporting ATPase subunit a
MLLLIKNVPLPNFRNVKKLRYLINMVISNKPLRLIIATFVACLPLMSFANQPVDSVHKVEASHELVAEGHAGELMLNLQM